LSASLAHHIIVPLVEKREPVLVEGRRWHLVIEGNKIFVSRSKGQAETILAASSDARAAMEHFLVQSATDAQDIGQRLRASEAASMAARTPQDTAYPGPPSDPESLVRALGPGILVTRVGGRYVINDPLPVIRPVSPGPEPDAPIPTQRRTWVVFRVVDRQGRPIEGLDAQVSLPDGRLHEERLGPSARISLHDVQQDGACELILRLPLDM
jgi:hypothetical protein